MDTKKAASVAMFSEPERDPGLAVAYADVRLEKSVEDARDTTVATVEGIAKNPFTILGYTWLLALFAWKRLPPFIRTLCGGWLVYFLLMLVVGRKGA